MGDRQPLVALDELVMRPVGVAERPAFGFQSLDDLFAIPFYAYIYAQIARRGQVKMRIILRKKYAVPTTARVR